MSDEKRTIFGYAPAPGQGPGQQQPGGQAPVASPQPQAPAPQAPAPQAPPPSAPPPQQPPMGMGQPPQASQQPPMGQPPMGQPPQGMNQQPMGRPPGGPQGPQNFAPPQQPQHNFPPPQGMPPQGMPPQGMPQQGMPQQGMPPQGMPPRQGMPHQGMPQPGMGHGRPQVKPVSTAFYVGGIVFGLLLGVVLFAWGASDSKVTELLMFAWVPMLVGFIVYYVLIYKAWAAINDGYVRTTPGKAVGFMFIPFFNIYWMFVALYGWSQDYNAFCQRHRIPAQPASTGLFMFHCIATLVLGIVTPITMIIIVVQMCRGINAVARGGMPQAVARY